ncbi:hypothetical protein BH23GEM2_BH23GEM2_24230 [soil metagenome]
MSEVIVQFNEAVESPTGGTYIPRAVGQPVRGGTWQGWIEFLPVGGGAAVRTERETTQSNREDLSYWASGLSGEYLESALERALEPGPVHTEPEIPPPQLPPPPRSRVAARGEPRAVLDPFAVYAQGESILRKELAALSVDHLRNIIRAYELDDAQGETPSSQARAELVARIVRAVKGSSSAA